MKQSKIRPVFFSPTGTSHKIVQAIARGLAHGREIRIEEIDCTFHTPAEMLSREEVAVVAVPVYGGHIAPRAVDRMSRIHGNGTPAIGVVVYGNRAFDKAAVELTGLLTELGFVPVAVAAFVGEHSYSTDSTPIAAGRPDQEDLRQAEEFGREVAAKLAREDFSPVDAARLKNPPTPLLPMLRFVSFIMRHRRAQKKHPQVFLPKTSAEKCSHCGHCVEVCPVQAITLSDELNTDPARCIRCCACVKECPSSARTFPNPFAEPLARNFKQRKPVVKLL